MNTIEICEFQRCLSSKIEEACREHSDIYQDKMKYLLDTVREYGAIGNCNCCTLEFIIYICFFCKDANGLVNDLRNILLKDFNDALASEIPEDEGETELPLKE